MNRKEFSVFKPRSYEELENAVKALPVDLPISNDLSPLFKEKTIGGKKLKNSLMIHPMEGADADENGAPTDVTCKKYHKFAEGGSALIWAEAIAVSLESRANPHQLTLIRQNLDQFKRLRDAIGNDTLCILQLTHSGRFCFDRPRLMHHNALLDRKYGVPEDCELISDTELDEVAASFAEATSLAREAGFDGVDIKACHMYLLGEALSGYERAGKYGGSYENRTRLLRDAFKASAKEAGDMILATRFASYDHMPRPYGFGADEQDFEKFDPREPVALLKELQKMGLSFVNSSVGCDYLEPSVNRPTNRKSAAMNEHPLVTLERMVQTEKVLKDAVPELAFTSGGYSYLGAFSPMLAAGTLRDGLIDVASFARLALSCPDFPKRIADGTLTPERVCRDCGACGASLGAGKVTDCVMQK